MASYDFTRLRRFSVIYNVVQVCLVGLLLFMSYNFMMAFAKYGMSGAFMKSFGMAIAVQLILIYPAFWLARQDVEVEVESALSNITADQQMALRKRRLVGDIWKLAALGAFAVFVAMSPGVDKGRGASMILAISYFSFLLVAITYFQCFNYIARKRRSELS